MNLNKDYATLLRDPRWQKKRLEVFSRDNFTCRFCGCGTRETHIHHTRYFKGLLPWQYEDRFLITLCAVCHEKETEHRYEADKNLSSALSSIGFSFSDIYKLTESIFEDKQEVVAFLRDKVFNRYKQKEYGSR